MSRLRIRDVLQKLDAGTPVDWQTLAIGLNESDRQILSELQLLHGVGAAHGGVTASEGNEPALRKWGTLQILAPIGAGQYGAVYRALDPRLGREVALKILRMPERSALVGGIIAEGHRLARVRHPNVVTVFGADSVDGRVGLWMELLDGSSLEHELQARGPFPAGEVATVGQQLASALAAVHEAGLLHRDVKTHNVLRDRNGRVVLADFGIGFDMTAGDPQAAPIAGTPLYLPQELLDGAAPSQSADIYSLGVLLYRLATGAYPVHGSTVDGLRAAHRAAHSRAPVPDPGLESVINRALEARPERRFGSAAQFEAALSRLTSPPRQSGAPAAAVYATLIAAVTLLLGVLATMPAAGPYALTLRQMTTQWEGAWLGRVTPDGQSILCSTGKGDLALCGIPDASVRRIASADAMGCQARGPFIEMSASGALLFLCQTFKLGYLKTVASDGTGLKTIVAPEGDEWLARPVGWSPDGGTSYAVITMRDMAQRLERIDTEGGSRTALKTFARDSPPQTFRLSPNGGVIAYDIPAALARHRSIVLLDLHTGQEHTLQPGPADDHAPFWAPDGTLLFSSNRSGVGAVWKVAVRAGIAVGDPVLVQETGRATMHLRGFQDGGSTLLYALQRSETDVFIAGLSAAGERPRESRRVMSDALAQSGAPEWSPDGGRLAFLKSWAGLTRAQHGGFLVVMDLSTGSTRELPTDGQPHQATIRWAPDGRSLFYRRFRVNRRPAIERIDVETGTVAEQVMEADAIVEFELVNNGRTIFFNGRGLRAFDLDTRVERLLHQETAPWAMDRFGGFAVSPDGQFVAYTCTDGKEWALRIVNVQSGEVRERLRQQHGMTVEAWTADGQAFLITQHGAENKRVVGWLPVSAGPFQSAGVAAPSVLQARLHPDGRQIAFMGIFESLELWKMENFSAGR